MIFSSRVSISLSHEIKKEEKEEEERGANRVSPHPPLFPVASFSPSRSQKKREKKEKKKHVIFKSKEKKTQISLLRRDLLLQLLDVGEQLLAAGLEQQVAVHEPRRVAQTDELEELGEQRHGVNGADNRRREPEEHDGAAGVEDGRGLVLDGVPLFFYLFNLFWFFGIEY